MRNKVLAALLTALLIFTTTSSFAFANPDARNTTANVQLQASSNDDSSGKFRHK